MLAEIGVSDVAKPFLLRLDATAKTPAAHELVATDSSAFMAAQFENPANPDYHYQTTAREIFEQMEGRIDAVTVGSGTAGRFTGIARFLKERLPNVYTVAVETQGSVARVPRKCVS